MRVVSRQTVKVGYDSWLHEVDIQQPKLVQLFCQEAVGLVWLIITDIAVLVVGRKPAPQPPPVATTPSSNLVTAAQGRIATGQLAGAC